MTMTGEIMTRNCQCVGEHETVRSAARMMSEMNIGALPICGDDDRLKGMITDRDIAVRVVAAGKDPGATEVGELAEGAPIWVSADAGLETAAELMASHDVRRLPVIMNHRLVGMVSQADIARAAPSKATGELVGAISAHPPNN